MEEGESPHCEGIAASKKDDREWNGVEGARKRQASEKWKGRFGHKLDGRQGIVWPSSGALKVVI
jgi:hypothetical protein